MTPNSVNKRRTFRFIRFQPLTFATFGFTGSINYFGLDASSLKLLDDQQFRRPGAPQGSQGLGSDKPTKPSVYPAAIEPAKPTRMKEIDFPGWPERLAQAALPDRQKQSFAITLRWYLSFCRRSRVAVCRQSARDFIAQVEQHKRPSPVQLERWKEGIRWFWRAARLQDRAVTSADRGPGLGERLDAGEAASAVRTADGSAAPVTPGSGAEGWEARLRRLLRVRHYSYRFTPQTHLDEVPGVVDIPLCDWPALVVRLEESHWTNPPPRPRLKPLNMDRTPSEPKNGRLPTPSKLPPPLCVVPSISPGSHLDSLTLLLDYHVAALKKLRRLPKTRSELN
jgi:hypothetical protein